MYSIYIPPGKNGEEAFPQWDAATGFFNLGFSRDFVNAGFQLYLHLVYVVDIMILALETIKRSSWLSLLDHHDYHNKTDLCSKLFLFPS